MNLNIIDQAINEAYEAALANPQQVPPYEIAPNVTLQTDTYVAPDGNGFRVVCRIRIPEANFTKTKVRNYGPDVQSEQDWPSEGIEFATKAHIARCISAGSLHVLSLGFDADRKVILLNKLLKIREAGNTNSYPKLFALYNWMEEVQAIAISGDTVFPDPPFSFEEVISE